MGLELMEIIRDVRALDQDLVFAGYDLKTEDLRFDPPKVIAFQNRKPLPKRQVKDGYIQVEQAFAEALGQFRSEDLLPSQIKLIFAELFPILRITTPSREPTYHEFTLNHQIKTGRAYRPFDKSDGGAIDYDAIVGVFSNHGWKINPENDHKLLGGSPKKPGMPYAPHPRYNSQKQL
jgi:hypothetical protein